MFISALELFKIGIGPSSSHTIGPILAAHTFIQSLECHLLASHSRSIIKGSLSATGRGHATNRAIALRLQHDYLPSDIAGYDSVY